MPENKLKEIADNADIIIAGYYLYYTMECVIECMHVHASDARLT